MGKSKSWTATGAARAARDARIDTVRFLRDAPLARAWQASKLMVTFNAMADHLRGQTNERNAKATAVTLLFTGLGYSESWRPGNWAEAAETILADEARGLAEADLYVLSPQMCDVVVAAAQTLTRDDLSLLAEDDLPSPTGLLVLPHPLLVRAISGGLGDDRAYHWRSPVSMPVANSEINAFERRPAVRISLFHDSHGPVRPDSFQELHQMAHAQGTPLPPLSLDAMKCVPFGLALTEEQRQSHRKFAVSARRSGQQLREVTDRLGFDEDRVIGEYTPGSEIDDPDDSFAARFLYAFWRLCAQRTADTTIAETRHSARVAADKAGVSPEVRVVNLRTEEKATEGAEETGRQWRHRWVVRMHKVRQWYPSEQRHKVIYRGPYVKGPDDKPLLGGEVVRGVV